MEPSQYFGQGFFSNNPHITERSFPVAEVAATSLLTAQRLDLIPKLRLAEAFVRGKSPEILVEDYSETIRVFSAGTYCEPGNPRKNSLHKYLESFRKLVLCIQKYGFSPDASLVPVDERGVILDGSHRVAACIATNNRVCVGTLPYRANSYDATYFERGLVPKSTLDTWTLLSLRYTSNLATFLVWPNASTAERHRVQAQLQALASDFIYWRDLPISYPGMRAVIAHTYLGQEWVGKAEDGYPGITSKADLSYQRRGILSVGIVKTSDVGLLKQTIRNAMRNGRLKLHSTDTSHEAKCLAEYVLNPNYQRLIQRGRPLRYSDFERDLLDFGVNLDAAGIPREDCLVVGSAALGVHGLRQPNDIDFVLRDDGKAAFLPQRYGNHAPYTETLPESPESLLADPRNYISVYGIRLLSLAHLATSNRGWNRDNKKASDAARIDAWLAEDVFAFRVASAQALLRRLWRSVRFRFYRPYQVLRARLARIRTLATTCPTRRKKWRW